MIGKFASLFDDDNAEVSFYQLLPEFTIEAIIEGESLVSIANGNNTIKIDSISYNYLKYHYACYLLLVYSVYNYGYFFMGVIVIVRISYYKHRIVLLEYVT